ncbi:MAG: MerC family mercury resistance protein [Acidobacteriota bacterium]|nr:MerC family mercury resistance protein [Acidobacteriota bacterium]
MSHSLEGLSGPEEIRQVDLTNGLTTVKERPRHLSWLDHIGAFLAGLCALHCFLLMLGSIVLGFTASSFFLNPGLRWLMVFLVASVAVGSLFAHGKHLEQGPAWLMVAGLAAIIIANLWGILASPGEVLSMCGGLFLAAGHLTQLSRAGRAHRSARISTRHHLPRKIALLLLLVTFMTTIFQLPSISGIFPLQDSRPAEARADEGSIGWKVLAQLDIRTGDIGPDLKNIIGGRARIPGFIVPLDQEGKTFLLVPYAGACIHTPPPPANQIVYVTMQAEATPIDPWSWEPIWVTGTLEIMEIRSPYGSAGFKMNGITTENYR